jgi:hypothetical protein
MSKSTEAVEDIHLVCDWRFPARHSFRGRATRVSFGRDGELQRVALESYFGRMARQFKEM